MATEAAAGASSTQDSRTSSLSVTLETALRAARAAGVTTAQGLDPPDVVQALFAVEHALARHSRTVRAKSAAWQSRIARGLLVDRFGAQASDLRTAVATAFDAETASGAGLPAVATHRFERRTQLLELVDATIRQAFAGQVANLEKLTLKRFNNQLLQTVNSPESTETVTTNNAATLRKNALLFDKAMEDLEVAVLGLSKDKAFRDISAKLNDALDAFPDSPAAKLKRTMLLNKIVNKEKEPGERSVSFGLDLVVMLRPDGFGSLQGYAGYQLPGGNSITFGVHNDADDPQVIAQFGGVRPPLLKVQPKLRIDVEM